MDAISRERAREIAASAREDRVVEAIRVLDFAETGWPRFNIYTARPIDPRDCWVAFYPTGGCALRSSQIAVISKSTGDVLYEGPANDEG